MNHHLVAKLRKKLENLHVGDYHGLNNPGLTCYLNSVLQVLFMTENFRDAVKSLRCGGKDSPTIDPHLRELFSDLETKMAETRDITEKLGITDVYKQRDAAEYFEKILCLTSPDASKIFKGELNHRTTCCKCNTRNESRSSFWILPLTVEDLRHKTYNVKQGLKAFFELQKVFGDDKIYCSRCNEKQDANIEWEINQHPDVLTLLLKRFTFDYKMKCYVKVHREADVPQTLRMEKCTYDLYAVVNHFGSLTGGHYTAEIKSFETGQWYCFSDDIVRSVKRQPFGAKENSLRSSTAYILLYRKVSEDPARTDGSDQEAQRAHSNAEAEGKSNKVERGETFVPLFQLESENDKGQNILKHLNGGLSKNCCEDRGWRKLTNSSGELDKQTNQRAAWVNKCELPQMDTEADEQQLDSNTKEDMCHPINRAKDLRTPKSPFQQKSNTPKNRPSRTAHETSSKVRGDTVPKAATKTSLPGSSPRKTRVKSAVTAAEENQKEAAKAVGIRGNSRPVRQRESSSVTGAD